MRNIYLERIASRQPLTEEEKQIIIDGGWAFLSDDYIHIPEDWDGCMAYGIRNIRRVLDDIKKIKGIQ